MRQAKRGLFASALTVLALIGSLLIAAPAFASVTQTHCQKNVCMRLVRNSSSGRTVISAYVYMPGTLTGADVSIRYVGYSAAGNLKGPQKSQPVHCDPLCAYKFTINYTYASKDWIYGTVIMSGTVEGTPTFTF